MTNTLWTPRSVLLLAALLFATANAAAAASSASLAASRESGLPAQSVLALVPAAARGSFLLYQLATAINSGDYPWLELEQEQEQELLVEQEIDSGWLAAMANEFQNVPVSENFPLQLQTWLMDSYGLSAVDVYRSWPTARSGRARQLTCNALGVCHELAQIVDACCPF
ncbi:uncharacterized protein Dvir_GJ12282, isoform B [Drosophila virilis]|uniref:Uncharacterized protein, isoform A n=1 Tax=Drosophila virilis TaxID=7244 RepID=B4LEY4_DROVI|nr:uncharacterized protein LOC6623679 [Drosophila virilis]XP_015030857.1 uncharacterized protein LOC6623679 [Drosophila virilis]EDW69153.1 uncharacterized protein Dvir_GJ12282, isoform A [Drosophila virilis]KRF84210.1 uncharacterized protein Dvir_GJ12282, isoform B [Drosophila virilis]